MYSEVDALRSKIIDKIILIILLFFSVLCFLDILRWKLTYWHEITIIHTVLFAILIILFVYRKGISLEYKVFILKDLLAIVGLVALWYFGFSGIHYFVIISIALVSIFTQRKRAFIFIGLLSVFYIAIGVLYASGIKEATVELNHFSHSLPHWITIVLSLIAFSAVYVAGFGEMHKELVNNIKKKISIKIELEKHVDELEDTKAKLDKTIKELNELNLKLQTSEERFSQLIRNSFDIIVLLDANGIQRYVSESCERILGYKPEELLNFPVIEKMIHPDDRKETMAGLKDIFENNKHGGTQYRHRHKNGGWVYLEAFGSNQIDNPQINYVVLNVRDITERKEAELALQQNEARLSELNATKDKLFSIIAHDLKSPFNSILGFSQLLKENFNDYSPEEQKSFLDIMHLGISNAYELLEDLLLWS
ncbi:MAG TPA: PAS domain S-box protein, partial [Draconibacterium sp.]|nr:PAS domain S-box protein [Draconibacterium sp.]